MKITNLAFCFIFTVLCNHAAIAEQGQWVEWIADFDVNYAHTNNLNLSAFSNDEESDSRLVLQADAGRIYQLNGQSRFSLAATILAERYQNFTGMDNHGFGIQTGFRHKFGLGFYQPYVQAHISYLDRTFDASVWGHDLSTFSLEFGKHINERLSLAVNAMLAHQDGDNGDVIVATLRSDPFDLDYWQASLIADYILTPQWLASAQIAYRNGDMNSACSTDNVARALELEKVDAITKDSIFGGCVYRLDTQVKRINVAISYALSAHSSISLFNEYFDGHGDVLSYSGFNTQVAFSYRY